MQNALVARRTLERQQQGASFDREQRKSRGSRRHQFAQAGRPRTLRRRIKVFDKHRIEITRNQALGNPLGCERVRLPVQQLGRKRCLVRARLQQPALDARGAQRSPLRIDPQDDEGAARFKHARGFAQQAKWIRADLEDRANHHQTDIGISDRPCIQIGLDRRVNQDAIAAGEMHVGDAKTLMTGQQRRAAEINAKLGARNHPLGHRRAHANKLRAQARGLLFAQPIMQPEQRGGLAGQVKIIDGFDPGRGICQHSGMITRHPPSAQACRFAAHCAQFLLTAAVLLMAGCANQPATRSQAPPPLADAVRPSPATPAPLKSSPPKPATVAQATALTTIASEPQAQADKREALATETKSAKKPNKKKAAEDTLLYKLLHPVEMLTGRKKKPKPEPGLAAPSNDLWLEYRKRSVLPSCNGAPIAERYAREYASMQSFMNRTMVRAEPFLYFILAQARAEGVPSDLVLLPIIESQFDPELTSSQGAAGMWQFMPATGRLMGLTINSSYDGRLDAFASTQAAMRYFKRLAERFDDNYLLAMAAYNVGDGRLLRALRGSYPPYDANTVFELQLPQETKNHIAKWQGLSCLFKDPERYGFELAAVPYTPQLRKINVGEAADLSKIGALSRLELDWLKHLNPGYRLGQTPAAGPHYFLLPIGNADRLDAALSRMGPAERSLLAASSATPTPAAPLTLFAGALPASGLRDPNIRARAGMAPAAGAEAHTVRSGENAWTIARSRGVRLADLLAVNGLNSKSALREGQRLRLPTGAGAAAARADPKRADAAASYVVRSGDSAWKIAKRFSISLDQLLKLNDMSRASRLKPGMRLRIQ